MSVCMSECYEYRGPRNANGYGLLSAGAPRQRSGQPGRPNGRGQVLLHRWIMEQVVGRPLLAREVVRHTCDNPPCFRFDHLRLGTQADNMRDMAERGRAHKTGATGSLNGQSKLTEEQVRQIKRIHSVPSRVVGEQYGVHGSVIRLIRAGKAWRHV